MPGTSKHPWLPAACIAAGAAFAVGVSLLGVLPPPVYHTGLACVAMLSLGVGAWAGLDSRRRAVRAERWERGKCLGCGYDIRENTGRCPECGRAFRIRTGEGRLRDRGNR